MTTPTRPTDDELPRDPAFDDAWHALSREEPSAALDAAMRAAAQREVGAGPQVAPTRDNALVRAPKPMNWWRPLAVAATLGALAIGLLQLVTPERISAPGRDGAVVSDMPATSAGQPLESAKKQAAPTASNEVAAAEQKMPAAEAPPTAAGGNVDRKEAPMRQQVVPPGQAVPHDELAPGNARKDLPAERLRETAPNAAPTMSPFAQEPPKRVAPPAGAPTASTLPARAAEEAAASAAREADQAASPASKVAPARAAEPFPADKHEEAMKKRDTSAADAVASSAQTASGAVAPAPPAPTDKALGARPSSEDRTDALAKLKTAPAAPTSERSAAVAHSPPPTRRALDAQAAPQDNVSMQAPKPPTALDAGLAQHPELAVPDWIALIRRLIAEKNFVTADKELAAFRAAHPDAQHLLPPDLRDWKAPR